jgi:hypothetical protein
MTRTRVLVSRKAASALFAEVQRWVEHGLEAQGAPLESLLYPLSAMVPAFEAGAACPLELVPLSQIGELVIDEVAIPPDAVKAYSPHNCHFSAQDMARANQEFNVAIDAVLDRRPRLGVLSKLHTHPFPAGAFLSRGDLYHGVTSPQASHWRYRRGLATALLHVVYPDNEPRSGNNHSWKVSGKGAEGAGTLWRIRSWGSDGGEMIDLGDAEIVSNRHSSVEAARRKPYWATGRGAKWCDAQKSALREHGFRVSRNLLGRGWRRYIVWLAGGRQLVVALPPDLPAVSPRVLEVLSAIDDRFALLPLPRAPTWGARTSSLAGMSLVDLVRHYGRPT